MRNYFTTTDPLSDIIKEVLHDETIQSEEHIITGWTNIVIEVKTNKDSYFFRFPRNPFWAKTIVKDAKFCQFISGKTSFYTPDMTLHYWQKRPFSMHRKIKGYSLNDRIYHLSHTALTSTAYNIAKFCKELAAIDIKTAPEEVKTPLKDFLHELDYRHYETHLDDDHRYITATDKSTSLVHGDLNLGNIILDENDQMVGVIDFGFAGTGHPYMDLARIMSRPTPDAFETTLITSYETLTHAKTDTKELTEMQQIWARIDQGYVNYIKRNHPEIILPRGM